MNNKDEIYIVIFSLIIIFIFIGIYVLYFILTKKTNTSNDNSNEPVFIQCGEDQCATNIITGEKRCPSDNEKVKAKAPLEVCNSRYLCDNNITPYALQSNGSTRRDGICQQGVECRCMREPSCATYTETVFYPIVNNTTLPLNEQEIIYNQRAKDRSSEPLKPEENEYCQIPVNWLNRSSPGCNFANVMNYDNLVQCMGLEGDSRSFPYACNTLPDNYNRDLQIPRTSPCMRGKLTVIGDDKINKDNLLNYPLSCINTNIDCKCGEVRTIIESTGEVVCVRY